MKEKCKYRETVIQPSLEEGEQLCWCGRTKWFHLMGKDVWEALLVRIAAWILAACAVIQLYLNRENGVEPAVVVTIEGVMFLFLVTPFADRWVLMRQRYWITDRRVIVMSWNRIFYSMDLSEIREVQLVEQHVEHPCLVLGNHIDEDCRCLRWRGCHPQLSELEENENQSRELVLYCVTNPGEALQQLKQLLVDNT